MNIAEFYVLLSAKGGDKTKKEVLGVDKALKDVKSTSLEAKAAIIGAVYALERMMTQSAQAGADLTSFTAATRMSVEEIQKYQYAGRQFNVDAQETINTMSNLQSLVAKMRMGEGAPAGLNLIGSTIGLDESQIDKATYLFNKLQDFAKRFKDPLANEALKSFGLSDKMIGAMRNNAFNEEAFSKAIVYTQKQAESLNKVNAMWGNFGDKIQKQFGGFTVKHGAQIIDDLSKIASAFERIATAMITISENLKIFDIMGKSAKGLEMLSRGEYAGKGTLKPEEEGVGHYKGIIRFFEGLRAQEQEDFEKMMKSKDPNWKPQDSLIQRSLNYKLPTAPQSQPGGAQINIEQNLNFENSENPHQNAQAQRTAAVQAYRQFQVGQVS